MNNPKRKSLRPLEKGKEVQPTTHDRLFVEWLNSALKDERWRAFIRTRLQETELPVIQTTTATKTKPRSPSQAA